MKKMIAFLFTALVAFSAQAEKSRYNLIANDIDSYANAAILGVSMHASMLNSQIGTEITIGAVRNENPRICHRLGALLVNSLQFANYGTRHVDSKVQVQSKKLVLLVINMNTYCGYQAQDIANPEYFKVLIGEENFAKIKNISTIDELQSELAALIEQISKIELK